MFACEFGHAQVIELLLSYGANIHEKNLDNETALTIAIKNSHKNLVNYLLLNGAL
jgi:ankyrin repeat protein